MTKTTLLLGFIFLSLITFQACEKNIGTESGKTNSLYVAETDCTGLTPTYAKDIKSIFDAKCATAGCHGANNPAHGLNLSTFETAKKDFNAHTFLCSINQEAGCDKMPQKGDKLPIMDIKRITCWAKNGFN